MPQKFKQCSVPDCQTKPTAVELNYKRNSNCEIDFFVFPKNNERCEIWKKFCNNPKLDLVKFATLTTSYYICSKHFKREDFIIYPSKLKKQVLPSLRTDNNIDGDGVFEETNLAFTCTNLAPPRTNLAPPRTNLAPPCTNLAPPRTNIAPPRPIPLWTNAQVPSTSKTISPSISSVFTMRKNSCNGPDTKKNKLSEKKHQKLKKLWDTEISRKKFLFTSAKNKEKTLKRLKKIYTLRKKAEGRSCFTNKELMKMNYVCKNLSNAERLILTSQLKTKTKPKGQRWTLEEKTLALSFFKKSPKSYRLLRCMVTLPSPRMLSRTLNKIPISTGINQSIFSSVAERVRQLNENDKHCYIIFDKIKIKKNLTFSRDADKIIGLVDQGEFGRGMKAAEQALVFMACGLFKKWKQPLAYYFSSGSGVNSHTLIQHLRTVIDHCEKVGLKVVATVCTVGSTNVQALKLLGSSRERPYFMHNGHKIITIFDPPHLLKCTMNMMQKHNVEFRVDTSSQKYEGLAKWDHIEKSYIIDKALGTFRWLWKLTDTHLSPKSKNKIKLATQVLSHSVSSSIMTHTACGLLETTAEGTAHFVEVCDRLFDSFNGNLKKDEMGKDLRCRIEKNSPHHEFWALIYECVDSWKFILPNGKTVRPSFQNGWLMTIAGFSVLWEQVNNTCKGIKYLVPRNISQDPLRSLFGSVRSYSGSNRNPTVSQFVGAFKTCLINGLAYQDFKPGANSEEDDGLFLANIKYFLEDQSQNESTYGVGGSTFECLEPNNVEGPDSFPSDWNSIAYVSGYIAKRLTSKNNTCALCKKGLLCSTVDITECFLSGIYFKEWENGQKRLTCPSYKLVESVGHCVSVLEKHLENKLHLDKVSETMMILVFEEVDFSWLQEQCSDHHDSVSIQIVESVCHMGIPWWCKKKNNELK